MISVSQIARGLALACVILAFVGCDTAPKERERLGTFDGKFTSIRVREISAKHVPLLKPRPIRVLKNGCAQFFSLVRSP